MAMLRYLCREDALTAGAGDWHAALADIRRSITLFAEGQAGMEPESAMALGGDQRRQAYGLPAWIGGEYDAAGLKWSVHRAEAEGGLPSIVSATFVNRLGNGSPIGIIESAMLTRMRTAAVTALAMQSLLPRPPEVVTILGAGEQAAAHLAMLRTLFPTLREIRLWNRSRERRDRLISQGLGAAIGNVPIPFQSRPPKSPGDNAPSGLAVTGFTLPVRALDRIEEAVDGADAVLTCTSSPQPLLGAWAVRPGRLIVQIGYHEVDFDAIAASDRVVVDLWGPFAEKSAKSLFQMYRAGQFQPEQVAADLVALVRGWRPPTGASIYFSSFGLNLFDIALAARILHQAEQAGLGATLAYP